MSFSTDWNVEKHKSEFECDEHWKLRREFILAHKDKFPEDRLICLAQVFFNIEFLGCKYPGKTMELVKELSKDVAAEHREAQKTKLQRTFVKASSAAESKIKRLKGNYAQQLEIPDESNNQTSSVNSNNSKEAYNSNTNISSNVVASTSSHDTLGNVYTLQSVGPNKSSLVHSVAPKSMPITVNDIKRKGGPFGDMVVFFRETTHPLEVLRFNARLWKKVCKFEEKCINLVWNAKMIFNSQVIGTAMDSNKKVAKLNACQMGLDYLMNCYYAVKIKKSVSNNGEVVETSKVLKGDEGTPDLFDEDPDSTKKVSLDEPLNDDNLGLKLLKMMGWTGGGLGKNQQGISEPIKPINLGKTRKGLGFNSQSGTGTVDEASVSNIRGQKRKWNDHNGSQGKKKKGNKHIISKELDAELAPIKQIILDYKHSTDLRDLIFSPDFTIEQRAALHMYAVKLMLKTKSHNNAEGNRYLVISKKIDNWVLVDGLLRDTEALSSKYELIPAGTYKKN